MNSLQIADSLSDQNLEPSVDTGACKCPICGDNYHEQDDRWRLPCPSFCIANHAKLQPDDTYVCSDDCACQWEENHIDEILEHYGELSLRAVTCEKKG